MKNFTLKGLSREYILRTFSPALANKVYPQYERENRGHTVKSEEHTLEIAQCILYLIDEKGFAAEKEVVRMLGNKYAYDQTELQIKKSLQEILLSYGLVKVKASKANKDRYNVIDNKLSYQCNIICREDN